MINNLYSPSPSVRFRQILGDGAVALWCGFWIWLGYKLYELVDKLGGAGRALQNAGNFDVADRLPGILRGGGDAIDNAGQGISNAGALQANAAHDLALAVGLCVGLIPVLTVLIPYVLRRLLWMKASSAIRNLKTSPDFERLMAQRALVRQPLYRIMKVSKTPLEDFAHGKYDHLAALEYSDFGIVKRRHH